MEDNSVNQMVLTAILKKMGVTTDIAKDGLIALNKLTINQYDLVLMDMQMPNMDGITATKKIREFTSESANTIIVAMTANARSKDRSDCMAAGMNDFISKPVQLPILTAVLDECFISV